MNKVFLSFFSALFLNFFLISTSIFPAAAAPALKENVSAVDTKDVDIKDAEADDLEEPEEFEDDLGLDVEAQDAEAEDMDLEDDLGDEDVSDDNLPDEASNLADVRDDSSEPAPQTDDLLEEAETDIKDNLGPDEETELTEDDLGLDEDVEDAEAEDMNLEDDLGDDDVSDDDLPDETSNLADDRDDSPAPQTEDLLEEAEIDIEDDLGPDEETELTEDDLGLDEDVEDAEAEDMSLEDDLGDDDVSDDDLPDETSNLADVRDDSPAPQTEDLLEEAETDVVDDLGLDEETETTEAEDDLDLDEDVEDTEVEDMDLEDDMGDDFDIDALLGNDGDEAAFEEEEEEESFDDDDEEEEAGSYSSVKGEKKLPLAPFGRLTFAPSPTAVTAGNLSERSQGLLAEAEAQRSKSFTLGIMYFDGLNAWISDNGNLRVTGKGRCGGKDFTFKLKSHTPGTPPAEGEEEGEDAETVYSLSFKDELKFTVRQEQEEWVKELELIMTGAESELVGEKTVTLEKTTVDARVVFGITPEDTVAVAELGNVPLKELFSAKQGTEEEAEESKIDGVMMENVEFSSPNPFMPEILERDISASGFAKLSSVKLFGDATLSDGDATITITPDTFGFECQGDEPIAFDKDVILELPLTEINIQTGDRPELTIAGTLAIQTAAFSTKLPVRGEIRDDGVELRGKVQEKVNAGPIKLANPELLFYTTDGTGGMNDEMQDRVQRSAKGGGGLKKTKKIELSSMMNFFGLKTKLIMRLVNSGEPIPSKKGKPVRWVKQIVGEFPGVTSLKPLDVIPGLKDIPGVSDFSIDMPGLGIDNTGSFMIKGLSKLMGVMCDVTVNTGKALGVQAISQKKWSIGQTVSGLAGSPLDFDFEQLSIGIQKGKRFDPNTNMMLEKGLNLYGAINMRQGVFKPLSKILGGALPKKLIGSIIINPNPRHCKAILTIPIDLKLSSKASLHSMMLEISGEPSFSLMVVLKFMPSPKDTPLLFTARIEFELIGVAVSGTMAGFWHHPFGIKGFHIGNLAVEIKLPYAAPPIPIAFGIAGTIQIGSALAEVAVKLGLDDIIVMAKIPVWPIYWTPELLRQAGLDLGPLNILKAIDLSFRDISFRFAPTGGQIGMLYFDPGISAEGKLVVKIPALINTVVHAGFNLDVMQGAKMFATMPNLTLGPLKITGKGRDEKKGTADDGPILRAILSLSEQRIYMQGQGELLGSKSEIEVEVGILSLKFKMVLKLLGMLEAEMTGETYRDRHRLGFRMRGVTTFGSSEVELLGDVNTLGGGFAGRIARLTIADIVILLTSTPAGLVVTRALKNAGLLVDLSLKDVECYIRAQGEA